MRLTLKTLLTLLILLSPTALLPAAKPTTIYLVRHAEKDVQKTDPGLSAAGQKRAECLASTLADSGIEAIYTSEYKRTQMTAAPLAEKLKLQAQIIPGAETDKLVEALQKEPGRVALVVGHSNTVPKAIEKLGAGPVTIQDDQYDRLFVVTWSAGQASVATLRYCL